MTCRIILLPCGNKDCPDHCGVYPPLVWRVLPLPRQSEV